MQGSSGGTAASVAMRLAPAGFCSDSGVADLPIQQPVIHLYLGPPPALLVLLHTKVHSSGSQIDT